MFFEKVFTVKRGEENFSPCLAPRPRVGVQTFFDPLSELGLQHAPDIRYVGEQFYLELGCACAYALL